MVALLCAMAILSYLDRYIVAVVAEPLMQDMSLSTTDVGLLIGVGFGLVYSIVGVPLAHLLDTGNRVRIVGTGVAIWSIATTLSGLADGFVQLLVTRVGVAVGEAILVPATVSLIADMFPPARRSVPIGLFMGVSTLMGAGAFILGGAAFDAAVGLTQTTGIAAWRFTFVFVGLPGVLVAAIWFATVREPARATAVVASSEGAAVAAVRHLRAHALFYVPFLLTFGVSALGNYSFFTWTSAMLVRSYELSVAQAAFYYGTLGLVAAAAGAFLWPVIGGRVLKAGKVAASVLVLGLGLVIGHTSVAALGVAPQISVAAPLIMTATFGFAAAGGLAVLIIQAVSPAHMRAKVTSLYVLMSNLIGLTCGPPMSAWLSETVFQGPDALRMSLSILCAVLAPVIALLLIAAAVSYSGLKRKALPA